MSYFVKGGIPPKGCGNCPYNYSSLKCTITKSTIDRDDEYRERLSDCPIVEVKESHDDLVDREWVRDSINHSCWLEYNDYLEAIGIIDDAPTIIEAEDNGWNKE